MEQWLSWELGSNLAGVIFFAVVLAVLLIPYAVAWARLRRSGNQTASAGRLAFWVAGLLVIVIATMSPIDELSVRLFSFHMIQNLLLINLAPPLLLLGRPLSLWKALGRQRGQATGEGATVENAACRAFQYLTRPRLAWGLATITLLLWHVPWLYDHALAHNVVHELVENTTLFLAFVVWWQPLIRSLPSSPYLDTNKGRFFYLLAGMAPMMLLSLLILFWPSVLYTYYVGAPQTYGLSTMLDQQIGGGIMFFSGMTVLIFLALPLQYREEASEAAD